MRTKDLAATPKSVGDVYAFVDVAMYELFIQSPARRAYQYSIDELLKIGGHKATVIKEPVKGPKSAMWWTVPKGTPGCHKGQSKVKWRFLNLLLDLHLGDLKKWFRYHYQTPGRFSENDDAKRIIRQIRNHGLCQPTVEWASLQLSAGPVDNPWVKGEYAHQLPSGKFKILLPREQKNQSVTDALELRYRSTPINGGRGLPRPIFPFGEFRGIPGFTVVMTDSVIRSRKAAKFLALRQGRKVDLQPHLVVQALEESPSYKAAERAVKSWFTRMYRDRRSQKVKALKRARRALGARYIPPHKRKVIRRQPPTVGSTRHPANKPVNPYAVGRVFPDTESFRVYMNYLGGRTITVPIAPHHKKYYYFLRKYGTAYFSTHHPYGDELDVYDIKYSRSFTVN
jgi:hypothetical protein